MLQKHKEQEEEKKRVRIRAKPQRPLLNRGFACHLCICVPHQCNLLQKEALEAAKLYEDFVESFAEDPAEKGPKAFVRGEVIQPGQRPSDSGLAYPLLSILRIWHNIFVVISTNCPDPPAGEPPRRAGKYVPKFLPPSMAAVLGVPESKPNVMEVAS